MTAGFIGLGDQGAPTSPRRAQPWAHRYRADVEVAVSATSGSVKPLPPEMEGLATDTKAAGTAADATSGQGSGHDAPLAIEVLAASPRLERIKRPAARCLRARDKGLKHWELVSIEEQTELVVRLFTHPFRLTSPQPGELGAGLIAGVGPHGVHIVREVDQETVGCDGIDRIHSVRPGCAARDRLLNRVKREVRYRFVVARLELSHSRDRDGRLLAATHGIMELDPALEPQTLSGALVAGEMSATTSDLTAGLVLFLVWWGANESETAPTGAHMDPHMWPEAGFERGSRQLALLDLSRGRYGAAFERLLPITRQDRIDFGILILADFIEAATRSGRPAEAKAAFERLAVRATAAAAPLGLGTLARCRAFLSDQEEAEGNYRESIMRLADANSAMELARSHLVLGEWLRRQRRRRDARLQLKIAYGMFSDFGATGFSERARIEFLATGGAARVRAASKPPKTSLPGCKEARIALGWSPAARPTGKSPSQAVYKPGHSRLPPAQGVPEARRLISNPAGPEDRGRGGPDARARRPGSWLAKPPTHLFQAICTSHGG